MFEDFLRKYKLETKYMIMLVSSQQALNPQKGVSGPHIRNRGPTDRQTDRRTAPTY